MYGGGTVIYCMRHYIYSMACIIVPMTMEQKERLLKLAAINEVFTPSAPINTTDLFSGRQKQLDKVIGAIFQRGQHAIIYGERGVGKTSLANILYDLLREMGKGDFQVARCNCAVGMTFADIWRTLLRQLAVERPQEGQLFSTFTLDTLLTEEATSESVRETLQLADSSTILIIDELDRVEAASVSTMLSDTIKTLSDHSLDSTLILVGVADKVDELISEHQSIERALVQVQMPRMSEQELLEIVQRGLFKADMAIEDCTRSKIANYSHGLPMYTHLLCRHSAEQALDRGDTTIGPQDLTAAMQEAVESQGETIKSAYHDAVSSPKKNLYKEVLLACALAPKNELGFFSAMDVREPMLKIMGKPYDIPAFSMHLKRFSTEGGKPILQKVGQSRRFRFRFVNPLMEPFVVMKGLADKLVSDEII